MIFLYNVLACRVSCLSCQSLKTCLIWRVSYKIVCLSIFVRHSLVITKKVFFNALANIGSLVAMMTWIPEAMMAP